MGRKPAIMKLIANRSSRATTFKKRRASILKKAQELSKLCAIDVCVLVLAGPEDTTPVVWPPPEQAAQIISRFQSQSEVVRSKKMSGQVAKLQHQLQKIEFQTDNILEDISRSDGSRVGDTTSPDSAANLSLSALVERRLKKVQDKINLLTSAQVHQLFHKQLDVEVRMPGVLDTIDLEQDPVMESIGADGTNLGINLSQVLPSMEEMSTGSDLISDGVPFLEWDDAVKDWVLKFKTGDVAPLPDLAEFNVDVGCATSGLFGAAIDSFPAGCTMEVGTLGLLDHTTDMEQDPFMESVGAGGTYLVSSREVLTSDQEEMLESAWVQQHPAALDVEVRMPGVLDTIDMEKDPVKESIGADGTNLDVNLPQVLPSEEEMSTGSDVISNGVPFLEWDDSVKDWVLKFKTGDVASLPNLAEFNVDVGCATSGPFGAATDSFPAGCTMEVGMLGLLDHTTDMEQDPVMESVGADGTYLVSSQEVLTSDQEEMLESSMGSDWISSGVSFPELDDAVKDWMFEINTKGMIYDLDRDFGFD